VRDFRNGGVAQVVEHLLSKCEALSSNPSTKKKRRKREKGEGGRRKGEREGEEEEDTLG
jgi:hypothetical protein